MSKRRFTLLSSLLVLIFVSGALAASETMPLPEVKTYDGLLQAIRVVQAASRTRIEQAVEQEKVREAWEIGKLIDEHTLLHKERAEYGKEVLKRLAADLEMSDRELYYMLQFSRTYPISPPGAKLSWSHYRALLSVHEPEKREALAREAVRESWDRDRLREEIRRRQLSEGSEEIASDLPPLKAQKGILDTYRIVKLEGRPVINLGFSNYLELPKKDTQRFKEGDIIHVDSSIIASPAGRGEAISLVKSATASLVPLHSFSYRVKVLEVTDGDTFWALVDLGFGITTKQQLRLRGLDAPEIESAEGKEAKAFLESLLAGPTPVMITSSRSDKYDRYLADVWVGESYVNQQLIDKGLAVRVSE